MAIKDKVKILKGISLSDTVQDELIDTIIEQTESALLGYLPDEDTVPTRLYYVVVDIAIKRYNRLGAEGVKKKTLEGLTMEFSDDDFQPYMEVIKPEDTAPTSNEGEVLFF